MLNRTPLKIAVQMALLAAPRRFSRNGIPDDADIAQREREQQREYEHADRVVPVEKLKRPAIFAGQFLRVGPRTPTQHRDDAKQDGHAKIVNDKHAESSFGYEPRWPRMNTDERRFRTEALSVSIRVYLWLSFISVTALVRRAGAAP